MEGRNQTPTEIVGAYQVFEKLGTGGMAVVHRAIKSGIAGFEREVALKRLLPHQAENPPVVEAFVREAKLAVKLRHPNIAQVYELGKVGDTYFISMEYVQGHDVRHLLRKLARERMCMPVRVAVAILLELCDALDHAHTRLDDITGEPLGIVHRDISPSNLIITQGGHLKVIDFGIAKASPRELATAGGRVKGKFGYMAPEALESEPLDGRSDIFSAGVVAHEILTTRRLFGARYDYEAIARFHRGDIEPPSTHNPKVPHDLDDVVLRALERDPDDRWQSAEALRDALYAVALRHGLEATSDQTADYLDFLFGEPAHIIIAPGMELTGGDEAWLETDIESVEEIDDLMLVEPTAGPGDPTARIEIELPPPRAETAPSGVFDIATPDEDSM